MTKTGKKKGWGNETFIQRELIWKDKETVGWGMDVCKIPIQKKRRKINKEPSRNGTQRNTK